MPIYVNFLFVFIHIALVLSTSLPDDPLNKISLSTAKESKGLKNTEINLEQMLKDHPKIVFLGRINNKSYFLERTLATQSEARITGCPSLGMALARIKSQEEMDFLGSVISTSDNSLWTDGRNIRNPSGYVWDNSAAVPRDVEFYYTAGVSVGLLLYNNAGVFTFRLAYETEEFYYLCYLAD